jgi:hypothetical protein
MVGDKNIIGDRAGVELCPRKRWVWGIGGPFCLCIRMAPHMLINGQKDKEEKQGRP